MIWKTLSNTKKATFQVFVPHPNPLKKGFPTPIGSGFFISKDGYFITARHVLLQRDKKNLYDTKGIQFQKPWESNPLDYLFDSQSRNLLS